MDIKKLFIAKNAGENSFKENVKTIVIALVVAFFFRSFAYEPFHIPSGSMKSNLLIGDYLFVSKLSYGYSRYSFPFPFKILPLEGRILATKPKRGDVIVFHPPGLPDTQWIKFPFGISIPTGGDSYIKRLIGLPGDTIQVKKGVLYINGQSLAKEPIGEWFDENKETTLNKYKETNPEGKSYTILNEKGSETADVENTEIYTVPEKHYFFMGDNRDNSRDSRFPSPVSFVPEENLIGRADLILFSFNYLNRFFIKIP